MLASKRTTARAAQCACVDLALMDIQDVHCRRTARIPICMHTLSAHLMDVQDVHCTLPSQPGQKVSPAFRKCEGFVILMEAIWIRVRSAANRVGTCKIFVTAHPRLKRMRTTFFNPRQCQESLTEAVNFYSCTKVLKKKVFIRPLQGQSMISMRCR